MNVQIENYSNIKSIRNYYIEPNLNREDKITITKRKGEHFKIKVIVQLRNNFFCVHACINILKYIFPFMIRKIEFKTLVPIS